MTVTEPHPARCPSCNDATGVDLSDGVRLCLSCRHEWKPADLPSVASVHGKIVPVDTITHAKPSAILDAETVYDVLNAEHYTAELATVIDIGSGEELPASPTDWAGAFVRDRNGFTWIVLDDAGDELVCQSSTGSEMTLYRHELTYLGDEPIGVGELVSDVDEDGALPQTMFAVAGLALTVALDCMTTDEHGEWKITAPRVGWLPPPANEIPEVECGVAYALAALIGVFGLEKEQVQRLAANLIQGAEVGSEMETNT